MQKDRHLKSAWLLGILLFCLAAPCDAAPDWAVQVVSIEIGGKPADKTEMEIVAPGKDKAEKQTLGTGQGVEQGTLLVVPQRTVLVLQSKNGNRHRLQPNTRFRVNVVSPEGESYSVRAGQVLFSVIKALDFFSVDHDKFYALVRGTEFAVAVEPQKEIRFNLIKGRLVVQREVKVRILEGDKVAELTAGEVLEQGKKTQVSYRLGVEEYLKEFKTFQDAEEYYRRQLQDDEKSGQYERIQLGRNALGVILYRLGKPREAIGYYERALAAARERRDQPWEAVLLNNLGAAWDDLGEHKKAIDYFTRALEIDRRVYGEQHPKVAIRYNNLGAAWWKLGEPQKAIDMYGRALKIDPANADVRTDMAIMFRNLKDYDRAVKELREAATDDPKHANSRFNLGIILLHDKKDYKGAITAWEEFLKVEPAGERSDAIRQRLGQLRSMVQ